MPPFPVVFPGLPYAEPNAPHPHPGGQPPNMLPQRMAQTMTGVSLGQAQVQPAAGCIGCAPQLDGITLRDIAPSTWPVWAKLLAALGTVGLVIAIVRFATK